MPEGSSVARLYLVGEAPGRREAESGRPFVGPAGQALREMLGEAGIDASSVRLANAIPYRPIERSRTGSRNRTPSANELRTLGRYALGDIAKVQPSFIGALGKSAAKLFGASGSVEEVRGRRFSFRGIPVGVTYHPSFVLRFGARGSELWRSAVADLGRFWRAAQSERSEAD